MTVPEETADNITEFCAACHAYFPERDAAYVRVCGECWHCWPTAEALVEHDARLRVEFADPGTVVYPRDVDAIFVCPCCAHDF